MSKPVSARACARELGIGVNSLLRRYRAGEIKSVIDSGRLIRFDPEAVRKALSAPKPPRKARSAKLPPGMVPTY